MFKDEADFEKVVGRLNIDTEPNLIHCENLRRQMLSAFNETHASIVVCLLSSDLQDAPLFRLTVKPTNENGLQVVSQIMVDKLVALKRDRIRAGVGSLDEDAMLSLNRSLMLFLGLP